MTKFIFNLFFLCFLTLSGIAQKNTINDVSFNDQICYCTATTATPDYILQKDNNWELLLNLRKPKTLYMLDSMRIKYTWSQIELLELYKLIIQNENSTYQSSIVIFDSLQTADLRDISSQISKNISQKIKPYINQLTVELKKINRERNAYSIIFSYILDNLVWNEFEKEGLTTKNEITIESPLWSGDFWSLYPKRVQSCGTNSFSNNGYELQINWNTNTKSILFEFMSNTEYIDTLMEGFIRKGKIENKPAINFLAEYDIVDQNGNVTIPIITLAKNNEIVFLANKISKTIKDYLKNQIDYQSILEKFNIPTKSQGLIILYHEILWDLMDELEKEKIIERPDAFNEKTAMTKKKMADLMILYQE